MATLEQIIKDLQEIADSGQTGGSSVGRRKAAEESKRLLELAKKTTMIIKIFYDIMGFIKTPIFLLFCFGKNRRNTIDKLLFCCPSELLVIVIMEVRIIIPTISLK